MIFCHARGGTPGRAFLFLLPASRRADTRLHLFARGLLTTCLSWSGDHEGTFIFPPASHRADFANVINAPKEPKPQQQRCPARFAGSKSPDTFPAAVSPA